MGVCVTGKPLPWREQPSYMAQMAFKSPQQWQQVFDDRHLRTIDRRWLGPWWERLVHQPLLFVLDKVAFPRGGGHERGNLTGEGPETRLGP
jgi:hypothetical protein